MHILHNVVHEFSIVLTGRICLTIRSFLIISFIFMTFRCDSAVTRGELRCQSPSWSLMVKVGLIKKSNQRFNRKMLNKGRDWWRSFFHRVPVYSGNKVPFCSRKKHIKIHFFLTVLTFARAPNGTSSTLFSDRFDFSRSRFSRACWVSSSYLASSLSWGRSNTTRGNTPTPDRVILLGSKWATLTCSTKQMKSRKDYVQRKGMLCRH